MKRTLLISLAIAFALSAGYPPQMETFDLLNKNGIRVVARPNIHHKFAIIDQKVVWYGSIHYLSYGNAEESVMRMESAHIANELLKSIED